VRILMKDPTKFFVFEDSSNDGKVNTSGDYAGPKLGAPIALRDHLREGQHQERVFPKMIGMEIKEEKKSAREKKAQERQARMLEAARQAAITEEQRLELSAGNSSELDLLPTMDYNQNEELIFAEMDAEWKRQTGDVDLEIPREVRYTTAHIEFAQRRLRKESSLLTAEFSNRLSIFKRMSKMQAQRATGLDEPFDEDGLEQRLFDLTAAQMLKLSDLDALYVEAIEDGEPLSEDYIQGVVDELPGLDVDDVKFILERDRTNLDPIEPVPKA
jgi:hypothetical protein